MTRVKIHIYGLSLIAAAVVSGCGGGGSEVSASEAQTSAAASDNHKIVSMVSIDTDVRKKVLYIGSSKGFVATSLAAKLPTGTQSEYDILVVGDADTLGESVLPSVKEALANAKEVVFDGPSDGSGRSTHAAILYEVAGTTIDSAAVRVEKSPKGYYVTPIDAPDIVKVKAQAAGTVQAGSQTNSVENIFELVAAGGAK